MSDRIATLILFSGFLFWPGEGKCHITCKAHEMMARLAIM